MRALALGMVMGMASCARAVPPCEPWVRWGLSDMADAPGQRLEACSATQMRFRVIPGGTRENFLRELGKRPYAGWETWKQTVLVRAGEPAVMVEAREVGSDLVVTLSVDPGLDVAAALRALHPPSPARPDAGE